MRIFCAVVMLSLGFAHKPVAAMAVSTVILDEAYRLPDGSFAEICEGHEAGQIAHDSGNTGDHSGKISLFCEACLLASSILLPTPDTNSWARAHFAWLVNPPPLYLASGHDVDRQRPKARSPPVFL
jgi:hypothetical protein